MIPGNSATAGPSLQLAPLHNRSVARLQQWQLKRGPRPSGHLCMQLSHTMRLLVLFLGHSLAAANLDLLLAANLLNLGVALLASLTGKT